MTLKRKNDTDPHATSKRVKLTTASSQPAPITIPAQGSVAQNNVDTGTQSQTKSNPSDSRVQKRRKIKKLAPPRPFPTVPTSVSATGPRSAHKEGKNIICVTRKTSLGAYMRRCKGVVLKDGYKTLNFSAMGAAIPLLLQLVAALPPILPFSTDEVTMHVTTGTVEVVDEVIPDDDDEDLTHETRGKSTLNVVLKFGDGEFEGDTSGSVKKRGKYRAVTSGGSSKSKGSNNRAAVQKDVENIVLQEPEQEEMEML
ncbi:hypothetical protein H0H92_011895 [Tricholoma furcatifolium]|nr:hypothetical protein H0H92_011895 [Tricholoma furcatifolium]